ncbi:MAG: gamma subclass chorismate mutase AroQ [Lentisphaerae bacterium]|nr:gamma subclass chorismate mutase AroQ [Lentisphaerota bacterium]MCP4103539.1 gamma subclass chorismate mutase AroQ [Lentisphaerota bacterium]
MKKFLYFSFLLVIITNLTACAKQISSPAEKNFNILCCLINMRLEYMKDVAAYKYKHNIPIEDKKHEKVVIAASVASAQKLGISASTAKDFLILQIKLAKKIQARWIQHWKKDGIPQDYIPMDLKRKVRPRLIIIGNQIILHLKTLKKYRLPAKLKRQILESKIRVEYISEDDKMMLLKAIDTIEKND